MEGGVLSVGSKLQPQYNSAPVYGKRSNRFNARTKNVLNVFFFLQNFQKCHQDVKF